MNNLEYSPDYRYYYVFNEHHCPLLNYLRRKIPYIRAEQRMFALIDIMLFLRLIINRECLFDAYNLDMIICDPCLEEALDVKALHIRQVADYVKKQLIPTRLLVNYRFFPPHITEGLKNGKTLQNFIDVPVLDNNANYHIKNDDLRRLLFPNTGHANCFNFKDICKALSNYIISNRTSLFDERNIYVVLVNRTLLGNAFGNMQAFHRCQVHTILKMQLTLASCPPPPPQQQQQNKQPISIVINLPPFSHLQPPNTKNTDSSQPSTATTTTTTTYSTKATATVTARTPTTTPNDLEHPLKKSRRSI